MKELFIKCPSCGAVLQVKNSKNEAVKKIACPNCKHRLAVSFEEDKRQSTAAPQPLGSLYYGEMPISLEEGVNKTQFPGSQHVELSVVRLADGGSKCIIKVLGTEETVKVNGETLKKDDQVVLAKGDKLEIGHVLLCYDKPSSLSDGGSEPTPPPPPSPKSNWWIYVAVGVVSFAVVVFLMWPKPKKSQVIKPSNDTTIVEAPKEKPEKPHEKVIKGDDGKKDIIKEETIKTPDYASMSDTELEVLARQDSKAQYEIGKRYVKTKKTGKIILGLNYLKGASKNGSVDANKAWQRCVEQLQQKAEQGDSVAYEILMKID